MPTDETTETIEELTASLDEMSRTLVRLGSLPNLDDDHRTLLGDVRASLTRAKEATARLREQAAPAGAAQYERRLFGYDYAYVRKGTDGPPLCTHCFPRHHAVLKPLPEDFDGFRGTHACPRCSQFFKLADKR